MLFQEEGSGRAFRRREIQSNWERYEITDSSAAEALDSVAQRGVDFTTLLASSSKTVYCVLLRQVDFYGWYMYTLLTGQFSLCDQVFKHLSRPICSFQNKILKLTVRSNIILCV